MNENIKRRMPSTYGEIKEGISITESKPITENKNLDLAVWTKNDTVLFMIRGIVIWFTKEEFIDTVRTLNESAGKLKV